MCSRCSRELLESLTGEDLSNAAFPFSTHKLVSVAGHAVRALRLTFVGELGWELHIPRESCVPVYRELMAAGAKYGITNAGYRAIDSLSAEKGEWALHSGAAQDPPAHDGSTQSNQNSHGSHGSCIEKTVRTKGQIIVATYTYHFVLRTLSRVQALAPGLAS